MILTDILTILAIILATSAIALLSAVTLSMIQRMLSKLQLQLPKKVVKEIKKKRRTENMSQAREGVTFNDIFMFMIAVPLVLLWVGFAGFVIHSGLGDSAVLENIEAYTTLIAILGGPALLIIKDALDVWKQEQAEKTAFYKSKAQAVIDYNASAQKQSQQIESNEQAHEHKVVKTVAKKK